MDYSYMPWERKRERRTDFLSRRELQKKELGRENGQRVQGRQQRHWLLVGLKPWCVKQRCLSGVTKIQGSCLYDHLPSLAPNATLPSHLLMLN